MWCRQCQQDVPVIRSQGGEAACPRCRGGLGRLLDDGGVELQSLDRPAAPARSHVPEIDPAAADLQRLARKLRPVAYTSVSVAQPPPMTAAFQAAPTTSLAQIKPTYATSDPAPVLWGPTLVLLAGFAALVGAIAAVAAHAAGHATVDVWRWGFVAALGGEGLLAGGFAWMTARLWRNNRRVNRRLELVERQLAEQRASSEHWRDASGTRLFTRPFSSRAA